MAPTLSAELLKAKEDAKCLAKTPAPADLLDMYAFYRQAVQEPPFESAEKPSKFALKDRAKYSAWEKVVKEGVTPEAAQTKYIDHVEGMKKTYGFDPSKEPVLWGAAA
ncbi:hypothetical protein BP5796_12719 [Coleophoma crateriformis]|uniref:ACB domain-containing protein n=1 Tax=Coleophoma crateriformis TaxID=565419 RepID=A0A3D8Q641_9HELO|nr:hypothetical protein BP5796_12719 [Coleophoma crateriformis]